MQRAMMNENASQHSAWRLTVTQNPVLKQFCIKHQNRDVKGCKVCCVTDFIQITKLKKQQKKPIRNYFLQIYMRELTPKVPQCALVETVLALLHK